MSTIDDYLPNGVSAWPRVIVSTLRDSGTGSLRAALAMSGPRWIDIRVGGTIELESRLVVSSGSVFLDGRNAPGQGLQIVNAALVVQNASDVYITDIRVRCGDEGPNADNDYALLVYGTAGGYCDNVVVANCSFAGGSGDGETVGIASDVRRMKLLDSIIARATVWSETGHCTGLTIATQGYRNLDMLIDRCLIAQSDTRNPLFQTGGRVRMQRCVIADPRYYYTEIQFESGSVEGLLWDANTLIEILGCTYIKGESFEPEYNRRPIAFAAPFVPGKVRVEGNGWTNGQEFTTQLELCGDKAGSPNSTETIVDASLLAADSGEGWEPVDAATVMALVGPAYRDDFDADIISDIENEVAYDNENDWALPTKYEARRSRLKMSWSTRAG